MGGIFVGVVFGLIQKTWLSLVGASVAYGIVCGGWIVARGLNSRDKASYLEVANREGRQMPSRGQAAVIEAIWQTIFCVGAGLVTKGIKVLLT